MAAAYVPPPPEEDFSEFATQTQTADNFSYAGTRSQRGLDMRDTDLELEYAGKFTADEEREAHPELGSFGGDGFLESTGYPYYSSGSVLTPVKFGAAQRVPETPALTGALRSIPPDTEDCRLNFSFDTPSVPGGRGSIGLRSVNEIPERYRSVFKCFSYFNYVQSKVFDDVMYTDKPLVASAPTGSGKTVIFELAIVRLLMQSREQMASSKVVYVAPVKALCSERFDDWQAKFGSLGLKCCELTGDSQLDDYFELQNANIVMTTPEKWDSMTRKWRDYRSLVQLVKLFLIDEVHQLNDETRGPTMEAIVSRMKTVRSSFSRSEDGEGCKLRFIAISATMPNVSDVAAWLGSSEDTPALEYSIDESHRPVRLRRVVLGYPDANSEFKFDFSLNYRLSSVIQCYSDQKPTLVFCATRKGTQQAANTLVKDARFVMNSQHRQRLLSAANSLKDTKLKDIVVYGVGYHHAGMDINDRKMIETLFTAGELPVLFATSTLAMGVNLPAHLVVIKSTMHYIGGMFQECSETQILQMIGRAGRPQFDTTATAVIMTRNSTKTKYEALLSGAQLIESFLHRNLIEHLNAEIVLHTITDVSIALEWLRSTFFYVRVKQNQKHYGMPEEHEKMEEKLQQLCLQNLNLLEANSLVKMDDGFILQPTETGRLMARYCVAFESMKRFLSLKGSETLADLVRELSLCQEFADVRLRVNEKRVLNSLNKDKNKPSIRYPMNGKIKSTDMKVNCLIQATLGCLPVQEFALNQDSQKIFRAASRLSKCLMELQMTGNCFPLLLNAILLHKCIQARLWENSKYVSKQLDKIGLMLSTTLVNAGLTNFKRIQASRPRELEMIMNRHPPFGNQISEAVSKVPNYSVTVEQSTNLSSHVCDLSITVHLTNHALLKETGNTFGSNHVSILLIGDADDKVLCKQRISDSQLMNGGLFSRKLTVQRAKVGDDIKVHFVSLEKVGTDVEEMFTPRYTTAPLISGANGRKPQSGCISAAESHDMNISRPVGGMGKENGSANQRGLRKTCNHRCINKNVCGHECCKVGVVTKDRSSSSSTRQDKSTPSAVPGNATPTSGSNGGRNRRCVMSREMEKHLNDMHAKAGSSATPSLRNIKPPLNLSINSTPSTSYSREPASSSFINRFSYTPRAPMTPSSSGYDLPTSHTKEASFSYSGARPSSSQSSYRRSPLTIVQQQRQEEGRARFPGSLALNLKSSLPQTADSNLNHSATLQLSPLSPIDPSSAFLGNEFSQRFEEDFNQFEDDVLCTAVFKGGQENACLTMKETNRSMNKFHTASGSRMEISRERLPFSNRKRIIDEMFEDCGEAAMSPPPKKVPSFQGVAREYQIEREEVDEWEKDDAGFVEESLSQRVPRRPENATSSQCTNFPSTITHECSSVSHNESDSEPSLARKLALKSGTAEMSLRSLADKHIVRPHLLPSPDEEQQVDLQQSSSLFSTVASHPQPRLPGHNANACSFFTAGPTSPEEEDGDMFGSVFAGIF